MTKIIELVRLNEVVKDGQWVLNIQCPLCGQEFGGHSYLCQDTERGPIFLDMYYYNGQIAHLFHEFPWDFVHDERFDCYVVEKGDDVHG
jgi:hypothetical protein